MKRINIRAKSILWRSPLKALHHRILSEGKNLGRGILKVDSFLNHQVDPVLMDECGRELARRFESVEATKILTAEISGIAPALATALHMGLPLIYARRTKPITMPEQVYLTTAPSHTRSHTVELMISPEYLTGADRILIIDDFLATGQTILGLARLAQAAGARVVGVGAVIEKTFEEGREALASLEVTIEALATVKDMSHGRIVLGERP